jgi:hypothetical protein
LLLKYLLIVTILPWQFGDKNGIMVTSWKPVLRTDFLWTCWGLNRIEHQFEAIYPHISVFTIVNPSPKSFLINLLPHSVTHYIEHLSSPFVLHRCNNCRPLPYPPQYQPSPTKMTQFVPQWSMIHEIVFRSKSNLHVYRCCGIYLSGVKTRQWTVSKKYPTTVYIPEAKWCQRPDKQI